MPGVVLAQILWTWHCSLTSNIAEIKWLQGQKLCKVEKSKNVFSWCKNIEEKRKKGKINGWHTHTTHIMSTGFYTGTYFSNLYPYPSQPMTSTCVGYAAYNDPNLFLKHISIKVKELSTIIIHFDHSFIHFPFLMPKTKTTIFLDSPCL